MLRVKRPPGRPRVDPTDKSVCLAVTVPAKQFDAYCEEARQRRCSLAEVVRKHLADTRRESTDSD